MRVKTEVFVVPLLCWQRWYQKLLYQDKRHMHSTRYAMFPNHRWMNSLFAAIVNRLTLFRFCFEKLACVDPGDSGRSLVLTALPMCKLKIIKNKKPLSPLKLHHCSVNLVVLLISPIVLVLSTLVAVNDILHKPFIQLQSLKFSLLTSNQFTVVLYDSSYLFLTFIVIVCLSCEFSKSKRSLWPRPTLSVSA